MATGIIGESFTFHALFVDATNAPTAVDDPAIEVFWFDSDGTKRVLVGPGEAMTAVVGTTGLYKYHYDIPTSFSAGDTLYALMSGDNPVTAEHYVVEDLLNLESSSSAGVGGMIAQFVRGG